MHTQTHTSTKMEILIKYFLFWFGFFVGRIFMNLSNRKKNIVLSSFFCCLFRFFLFFSDANRKPQLFAYWFYGRISLYSTKYICLVDFHMILCTLSETYYIVSLSLSLVSHHSCFIRNQNDIEHNHFFLLLLLWLLLLVWTLRRRWWQWWFWPCDGGAVFRSIKLKRRWVNNLCRLKSRW